jgi:hypothetical protein
VRRVPIESVVAARQALARGWRSSEDRHDLAMNFSPE